ncbi:MAG: sugar ABC transporter permease [Chloroflexi bacterium]|nr:sugar ABC transporter permease [Chloroflexota bacterium]
MASDSTVMVPQKAQTRPKRHFEFELPDKTWRWILLLPAVIVVVVLLAIPILWTLYAAFTDLHLFRIGVPTSFVGLKNFDTLLHNSSFWRTVKNTVIFMLGVVPAQLIVGMGVALCLDNITRGRKFFRTWFLMPLMVSPVVVSFVVGRMLFAEDIGPVNEFLRFLGFKGIPWFTNSTWAMVMLMIVDVWQWSSFMILMLMAGLQGIPPDLHEAANVDGATAWQSFWRITMPLLVPILVTALLIRIIDAFKVVDIVMVLTGGGPGQATETVTLAIYRTGVKGGDLAFGSSQAYFLMIIMLVFGGAFLFMSRRALGRSD